MSDILWAGWRAGYLEELVGPGAHRPCLFCGLPKGGDDEGHVLERGEAAFSVLNLYPYTSGHIMVAPFRHVATLSGLEVAEVNEIWRLVVRAEAALDATYAPHGYNLGVNLGRAGGAGVPGHLHVHLVPRYEGDANFMTTVANTRVIPESIDGTWERLRAALSEIG